MVTKFYSEYGVLDLSYVKISLQDNNSRTNDKTTTKFMLPFEVVADDDFLKKYIPLEATELKNKISGILEIENKIHEAVLFIQTIQGDTIIGQIDYGLEEAPNFSKKLSELPLENYDVTDIYTYAKQIAEKKWPQTNFNFPRIFTKKYNPEDTMWQAFDGYYNDMKPDGSEMRRNYIDGSSNIFNVNIIHPCPHILYLLKTGFADAGYTLEGEILTDPNLLNRWVFSGTEYFSTLSQRRLVFLINIFDYIQSQQLVMGRTLGIYEKTMTIPKKGQYKLLGVIRMREQGITNPKVTIQLNGSTIYYWSKDKDEDLHFNLDFNVLQENSELKIFGARTFGQTETEPFVELEIISDALDLTNEPGEETGVVRNLNKIDLRKAVPEITFGELVNTIKNWFNYDLDIIEKRVIMNRIGGIPMSEVKDFKEMEVPEYLVKRNLLNKRSFLLKFPELDENKKDNMFYDISGPLLNGKENSETNIIQINGYAMPVKIPKPNGHNTAIVCKDSSDLVALVEYSGMQGVNNNATNSPGCDFPELFPTNWESWLKLRISGQEFNWSKKCKIEGISNFTVKDYIFCYNNFMIVRSFNKEKISKDEYQVEITTESLV